MAKRKLTEEDRRIRALRQRFQDLSWFKHWLKHMGKCKCINAVPTYGAKEGGER